MFPPAWLFPEPLRLTIPLFDAAGAGTVAPEDQPPKSSSGSIFATLALLSVAAVAELLQAKASTGTDLVAAGDDTEL